ncbi:hypothetical protein [Aminipila sp.]
MLLMIKKSTLMSICLVVLVFLAIILGGRIFVSMFYSEDTLKTKEECEEDYIKWVDYNVPCEAMKKALQLDIDSRDEEIQLNWIELLAYLAAKN